MNNITINCDPIPIKTAENSVNAEPTFVLPSPVPTQEAIEGICFDFNYGLRILFPSSGDYRCVFTDLVQR